MGYYPRSTQLLAVLLLIDQQRMLGEIHTGEGKSDIVRMFAAYKSLEGRKVDIVTSSSILAIRDAAESQLFFSHFNLSVSHICCDLRLPSLFCADIIFGDSASYQFSILNDVFFQRGLRNHRKFDVVIVNEVDAMLLDGSDFIAYISKKVDDLDEYRWLYSIVWDTVNHYDKEHRSDAIDRVKALVQELNILALFPSYMTDFFTYCLEKWPAKAFNAKHDFERDKDYTASNESGIVPVDYGNTGVIQAGRKYSNGVHQFLSLKESMPLVAEDLTAAFISNMALFKLYSDLYGVTGTMGNAAEKAEMRDVYDVQFFKMPTFRPLVSVVFDGALFWSVTGWYSAIVKASTEMLRVHHRPVLVIFESIYQLKVFAHYLSHEEISPIMIDGTESSSERALRVTAAGEVDAICIATNIAGRGMDIKLSAAAVSNGGLHVIRTYIERNSRVEEQVTGRTGRSGQPGSSQLIARDDMCSASGTNPSRIALLTLRDLEYNRLAELRHQFTVPIAKLKDLAFLHFCQLLFDESSVHNETLRRLPNGFEAMWVIIQPFLPEGEELPVMPTKQLKFSDEYEREGAKLRWNFWLARHRDSYSNGDLLNRGALLKMFFNSFCVFMRDLADSLGNQPVILNPFILVRRGVERDSLEDFDRALALDSSCVAAWIHKARVCSKVNKVKNAVLALRSVQEPMRLLVARYHRISSEMKNAEYLRPLHDLLIAIAKHLKLTLEALQPEKKLEFLTWSQVRLLATNKALGRFFTLRYAGSLSR